MRRSSLVGRLGGVLILAVLILAAFAAIRWQATLDALGEFLIDRQPPQDADLVLVLGGDFWGPRVITGAELVRHHYAPFALISGPLYRDRPEGYWAVDFLVKKGYPRDFFKIFFAPARSTIEEAEALRGELERRRVHRVLLVTSNYHSRRAAIVLSLFCPGVKFISAPAADEHYHAAQWWRDPSSRSLFFSEWGKILGTILVSYPESLLSRLGMAIVAKESAVARGAQEDFSNFHDPLSSGDGLKTLRPLQPQVQGALL